MIGRNVKEVGDELYLGNNFSKHYKIIMQNNQIEI